MPPHQDSQRPFFATPCHEMGIDALELLAKQIVVAVQNLVSTPLRERQPLLQSLQVTFIQGLTIIAGLMNATAPINRIPPELLTHIFALSPETVTISVAERPAHWPSGGVNVSDLHNLPKVCRYWRDLALATPTLWTTVSATCRSTDGNGKSLFRRSIYLSDDSSVGLVAYCAQVGDLISQDCREKMTKFILANAPRLRELHMGRHAIQDFPLFLRSFDASTVEHCTLWDRDHWYGKQEPSHKTSVMPLFGRGGNRLRSLSLTGIEALPSNEFPALTLLSIHVASPHWDASDLVKFLAGSPRLEEVHVRHLQSEPRHLSSPPRSPGPNTPIALPRLQYLAFTCNESQINELDPARADPIEYLLSHISIPSTCHMSFGVERAGSSKCVINRAILDSVRHHVDGKNEVSHVFLALSLGWSGIQLVFSKGSLRLTSSCSFNDSITTLAGHFADTFYPFQELFARTVDIRLLFNHSDSYMNRITSFLASSGSFHEILPNLAAISLINVGNYLGNQKSFSHVTKELDMVRQAVDRPAVPRRPQSEIRGGLDINVNRGSIPWPALDTLWVPVQSWEEIANLEAMLVACATLGCPIRCVIVAVFYGTSEENAEDVAAQLRALSAEEVILMEMDPNRGYLGAIDWIETLPERFSLPSVIRRDWPTMWYRKK